MNDFIDRTELRDSAFDLTEEPFNFSIRLRVFYPGRDMFDVVKNKELSEFMVSMFTVPCRNELCSVVSQDLAGRTLFLEALIQNRDGVVGSWRVENTVTGDKAG